MFSIQVFAVTFVDEVLINVLVLLLMEAFIFCLIFVRTIVFMSNRRFLATKF